jgi:putative transposase
MKRGRVTGEQIIGILREQEAGASVADLCRNYGMSSAPFCAWTSTYGGMVPSGARRLKALAAENAKLKRLCADATPDSPEDQKTVRWPVFPRDRADRPARQGRHHRQRQRDRVHQQGCPEMGEG